MRCNTNAPNAWPLVVRCSSKPEKPVTICLSISVVAKLSSAFGEQTESCKINSKGHREEASKVDRVD
jgi:hypothetical protein